jgi:tRNA A-37 threonylcarbamoyl transferase component Bud32
LYDHTDNIQVLTTKIDPTVVVKLQRDPRLSHVAAEMAHEAKIYAALEGNATVKEVIPRFRGYSTHLGVAMTCIERELDDFDDIGLENLSESLKQSAVRGVELLSQAGVLHNDIELRNIVMSKDDPSRAKIIDFGRASFSSDRELLAKQVESVKILLDAQKVDIEGNF